MNTPYALAAAFLLAALPAAPARAQALRIALSSEPTSVDPHYHDLAPNNALALHLYGTLSSLDAKQSLAPGLATAWRNDGANKWTFQLRKGVAFSNGQPFTADDVVFTFCRTLNNETGISSGNKDLINIMRAVTAPDPHTLVIETTAPEPLLALRLAGLAILSQSIVPHGRITFTPESKCGVTGPWPTVGQFNDGTMAIGTGPYRLKSYVKGSGIELERNDGYWGPKPAWESVKMVAVTNAGPRLAGLLSGDFDLIEQPAARDLPRLKGDKRFAYVMTPASRVIFLQFDVGRSPSPFARDESGGNPLQDVRVRKAIAMAIDREAIVKRIMDGGAQVANQFLPTGGFGTLPNPPAVRFDPAAARKLLAEAGYKNGFDLTVSATNDRYVNDGQIAQAVAQYLTQVGLRVKVDAMTRAIYFPRRAKKDFSFALGGWGSSEALSFFRQWAATPDDKKTMGGSNYGDFNDPEFNALVAKAMTTMDDAARAEVLRKAGERLLASYAFLPLHFENTIWAYRAGISYEGRVDQYTLAMSAKPAR